MTQVEPADQPISFRRTAELAGLSYETLAVQASRGKLATIRYGHERLTTRRLLHNYLMNRDGTLGGQPVPLPADYQTPE
jgi:hypothetical protein